LTVLLRAAKEQPADDLPRFVLADWLEEHGELARAEFIRVQCRLASLFESHPDVPALRHREQQLRAAHAARWVGGMKRFTRFSVFERGLLFLEVSSPDCFLHPRAQAERRPEVYDWVSGLQFLPGQASRALQRFPGQAGAFAGLTHLQLSLRGSEEDLARFLELPQLELLTHLDLSGCALGKAGIAALARSPALARLTVLGLDHTQVDDKGIAELAASPHLGRLTTLSLAGNPVTDRGVQRLADSACLRNLQTVALFQQPIHAQLSAFGKAILRERFTGGLHYVSLGIPPLPPSARRRNG
jgi:uncharacterized protein (TIGR02996 family)